MCIYSGEMNLRNWESIYYTEVCVCVWVQA